VPHVVLWNYDDDMNFWQRCHNVLFSMADVLLRKFYYMPAMERMARESFKDLAGPLPSIADLEKSISMILVNNNFAMSPARPLMPGMVNIGGVHMKTVKSLPTDVQQFLDEAEHGAIYMSLGAYVQSSSMPKDKMKVLFKVFGSLKQRVLWKFETDDLPQLPSNMMIKKWMPQSDILAHKNVVLFISHGGLFGTTEGSFRGVPILFMPFFGDQFRNAKLARQRGYAEQILFSDVTEESFKAKVNEMVTDKRYLAKAKEVSGLLNDSPVTPLNDTIYWLDYVVKYKGAKHLKSAGIKLYWYEYLMLDIAVVFLALLWILFRLMRSAFKMICGKRERNELDKKKN